MFGGIGALFGGLFIFRFIKDGIPVKFFGWLISFIGALIAASPLPDEVGLAMNIKIFRDYAFTSWQVKRPVYNFSATCILKIVFFVFARKEVIPHDWNTNVVVRVVF